MTDRTGGPSSPHYPHRRRPESYAESDDELSAGEDTQPLRARQGDPGNPHADAEDARKGRQDLQLARSLRLRAEGVEKVVIGMLEGGPGGGGTGTGGAGGGGRPGVGRTGTGNSRTTSSGSSPNRLPNGVRLRLALGTIINDLFARQAPPPPYRHTHSAAAAAGSSPSTSRTSGSTPMSSADHMSGDADEDDELPRALWTLAPASAAFVKPRKPKRKPKKKGGQQQQGHGHGHTQGPSPSYSGQQPMPSMTSTPAYMDYSAQFPPPPPGVAAAQWHPNFQALQQFSHQQQQQYNGQSPQYQQYGGGQMNQPTPPGQQRPSSSSSSMSMHPRPSSSSSAMMTPPVAHYQTPPHSQSHHQQHQNQRLPSHPFSHTPHTPPTHTHTSTPQSNANSNPSSKQSKPKTALPAPSSRTTRLYSVGADPDTANSPPAFRCPRHLHTGCEICVEAKASVGAISAKGHGGPRDTRVTSPGGPPPSMGNGHTPSYTYAPGAGSSYAAMQGQGLNSWRASVVPGGLAPGGGGITGWQDGSGIGSGLLRPGVRGSALRRKTVVPEYGVASPSSGGGFGSTDGGEGRGAGNTKLSRLIPRFIRLSALVAAELGRESRGEEAGVGGGGSSAFASGAGAGPMSPGGGDKDGYTSPPPPNSRRSSDVNMTPRQQRQRTNTVGSASSVTPTRYSFQANNTQTQTHSHNHSASTSTLGSKDKDKDTSNANALRPTKEWYMLLAGLLTRAVLEGYLTGGWRGLRAVQCLLMVGLGVSAGDGADGAGQRMGKRRTHRELINLVEQEEGDDHEHEDGASGTDIDSDGGSNDDNDEEEEEEESGTDASDADPDANTHERLLGLGFRLPVAGRDDDAADNEDGDEEFAELDPDELPDLVEAVRILFPSLRRGMGDEGAAGKGKEREREGERARGGGGDEERIEDEDGKGRREGEKGEAEAEYEEEMLVRLRRFYAIPESTPDCATHMEDLAWQYPAEPVERAAVRFCEAIARWRGKPELETYKKKPAPNGAQRDGDAETGGMSIDSLVHSNPVSPTIGAAQVQQVEIEGISAVLGSSPPRKKRQPAIEDYFTGMKPRHGQSQSPEHSRLQQQYQGQQQQGNESPSWSRSGGGPNKRFRDPADDGGRAEKRISFGYRLGAACVRIYYD
ncbi:hypothetical protein D9619_003961 [Psilocybe cf. subviscida]|uniref:Uncharacterized protein n=1 Tax=Psilocybe cf. subviscida TaxID=2480587 RepID=A0A8H5F831_9AGAR|nr:hypothetical protein D9619_003961 [Psilocybe cf. subviscida]